MTVMHTTIWSASSSFGLDNAASMAWKLYREYQRYLNANETDDRRDAAINGAITAWHMCEWVWTGITSHDRHSVNIKAFLGVRGRSMELGDIQDWAERECSSVQICRSICNGSKHVISDLSMQAEMSTPDPAERERGKQLIARAIIKHSDGSATDMKQVLLDVVDFWGRQVTNQSAMR
ncbi:hypothetical protein [Methylobacterium sp. J-092]|uniref:hypothetical protein n=1 Tax=Methylobacterium sp. J-092 TaxID=2836667 RepID=UPI001FBAAFF1|nr:hypothetical protein [Methylobacterium sp. J-092]MCJ2009847.1 hypothetical protein [Methylobacterium sp. J-092]